MKYLILLLLLSCSASTMSFADFKIKAKSIANKYCSIPGYGFISYIKYNVYNELIQGHSAVIKCTFGKELRIGEDSEIDTGE